MLCGKGNPHFRFFAWEKDSISKSDEQDERTRREREKMIDLDKPALKEHLRRRTPEGRYEISDIDLVLIFAHERRRATLAVCVYFAKHFWSAALPSSSGGLM